MNELATRAFPGVYVESQSTCIDNTQLQIHLFTRRLMHEGNYVSLLALSLRSTNIALSS